MYFTTINAIIPIPFSYFIVLDLYWKSRHQNHPQTRCLFYDQSNHQTTIHLVVRYGYFNQLIGDFPKAFIWLIFVQSTIENCSGSFYTAQYHI